MADEVVIPGSTSTEGEPSESNALTPEMRDAQTFAKYGYKPDGSPLDPTPDEPVVEEKTDEADPPANPDADPPEDADDPDKEGETSEERELTDEDFDRVVDAVLELNADKLAKNPKLREAIEKEVRAELEAKLEAERRTTTASQDRVELIRQGREAVEAVVTLVQKAQDELAKAEAGETFDAKAVDPKGIGDQLAKYGAAAVADTRRSYDDAFGLGFKAATQVAGPISEAERDSIMAIVKKANEIEADEKQGDSRFDIAKNHLYVETFKFSVQRAFEAGKVAALNEAKTKREAAKTVLDADAVLAGAAKEAKARRGLPPPPTPTGTTESTAPATMEAYQAAKRAKNYDLADEIMSRMQASAPRRR